MTSIYLFSSDQSRDAYCSVRPELAENAKSIQRNQIVYANGDMKLFFVVSGPIPHIEIDRIFNLTNEENHETT